MAALKDRLGLAIRACLSIGVIAALAYNIGSKDIIAHFGAGVWPSLALATVILAISVLLVTPRWAMILSVLGCRASWRELYGSVFLGFLFNQLLPTAVGGDVFRAWRAKQLGATWEVAIHSVIFDRGTGVLISLIGAAILLPFAGFHKGGSILEWIVGTTAALVLAGVMVLWAFGRWRHARLALLSGLHNRIIGLHDNAWAFVRRPRASAMIFLLAALNQMLPVAAVWIFAREMNIPLPALDIALITFIATLAATVPISVAGWGIREGTLVYLFGLYGIPPDAAFAVSILFGLALTLSATPGALVLLRGRPTPPPAEMLRDDHRPVDQTRS